MTSNVGTMGRAIRFVLGVILIALGLTHVLTGHGHRRVLRGWYRAAYRAIRFCPAWSLFGINTCPLKAKESM